MSLSPRDMDFINAKYASARDVAFAFGLPPQMLGIPGDNTYSNLAEARLALWEQTILPMLDQLCDAVFELAHRHCGALLAIERDIGLRNYAESGVDLDAAFSSELLLTIFHPKTALHDGGVILRDSRIVAAACIFPVSQRESLDRSFGLRHRAGLGLSEETDALALVVSEETGSVSLCNGRTIRRGLTRAELRRLLGQALLFENNGAAVPAVAIPAASAADNRDAA